MRVFGRQSAQGNVFVEANWIHNTKKQGVISEAETYYVDGTAMPEKEESVGKETSRRTY